MDGTRVIGYRSRAWTLATLMVALPLLAILCSTLWRSPYPLSETVGTFEDVARRPPAAFLTPTSSYYRPLYFLTLSAIWHQAPSLNAVLAANKVLLHILPATVLVVAFIAHLRPRSALEAAAATLAVAVLVGSPGFLGNLELPLSYTIVGMPAALLVWMLLEREGRRWHGPAIIVLTLIAIGFKEQGLIVAPAVLVGWWMRAPGVGRATAAAVAAIAAVYVVFRLVYLGPPEQLFEQDIGYGLTAMSHEQAEARFGAFPWWIFAYNALSTVSNVLFAEPTDGVFRFVRAFLYGTTEPWHLLYLLSSVSLTALVAWWGTGVLRNAITREWTSESRLFVVMIVALLASGALSFNYSRDRLGGMAVVFYALAAFFAVREAAGRAARAPRVVCAAAALALLLLAGAWQLRALYTVEFTKQRAVNSRREWIAGLQRRRTDFAGRPEYLRTMEAMRHQGTAPHGVRRTRYPRWFLRLLGEY